VFPKADHVNVGVGAWQEEGPRIREHLARVCAAHGLDPTQLDGLRGHRLPLRRRETILANERALLVGDAAGLIDPVSGDGMYECFVSSRLAAEAILAGRLEEYPAALDAVVARLHGASWKLKRALDRWPSTSWRIARTKLLWRSVERLLLGDVAAPSDVHGAARVPLRLLDALARIR
jgi:flavin-dependent dehydrogenase